MSERPLLIIDKLRELDVRSAEDLRLVFEAEQIKLSPKELQHLGPSILTRLGYGAGFYKIPDWLTDSVLPEILAGAKADTICDPCAGIGVLIAFLREMIRSPEAIALTDVRGEYELGRILVRDVHWQLGDPLDLLASVETEFDLVASILPFGRATRAPVELRRRDGDVTTIRDDFGNLILVQASMCLAQEGVGLFVVPPSFFFSQRSVFRRFQEFGLGIEAALAMPPGSFAPLTNISTYLVIVRRKVIERMFVAQLTTDAQTNHQIVQNLRAGKEVPALELGRVVDPHTFTGIAPIRVEEKLRAAEKRFTGRAVALGELATTIRLGRFGPDFEFPPEPNAIYVPLIGNRSVVESLDELTLKRQNYAQVVINPQLSDAGFVARFLNSEIGREITSSSKAGFIPKLNKQRLTELRVFVPALAVQRRILEIEGRITAEHNTLVGLQIELEELRQDLWKDPSSAPQILNQVELFSKKLSGALETQSSESLDRWAESLPFPLASVLRAWQATPGDDYKTKYEHLLHFFEATAEFVSVILLSAFSSNTAVFALHKQRLATKLQEQRLSFERTSFGTWKLVVEYLGKQTRLLLSAKGTSAESAETVSLCKDLFADESLLLPDRLSRKAVATVLAATNKMRNDWSGHGGVVGQDEAKLRNEKLLAELQKVREALGNLWEETELIHALFCRPRRGMFENQVAMLMGSNSEFVKQTRVMATWLDVEQLYLSRKTASRALKLLPLVQVGPGPQSAKNACYFFNRLERDGARFISYHFIDQPQLTGEFEDTAETIRLLTTLDNE